MYMYLKLKKLHQPPAAPDRHLHELFVSHVYRHRRTDWSITNRQCIYCLYSIFRYLKHTIPGDGEMIGLQITDITDGNSSFKKSPLTVNIFGNNHSLANVTIIQWYIYPTDFCLDSRTRMILTHGCPTSPDQTPKGLFQCVQVVRNVAPTDG
jgi:hypothetical protein